MKKYIAVAVLMIFGYFGFRASAQETKLHNFTVGGDYGVTSGAYSWGYRYTNNGGITQSGTDYHSGSPTGGNVQYIERPGWIVGIRYRRQTIGNPLFWLKQVGEPTQYWDGSTSNAYEQYGGHFSALDIEQRIPLMSRKLAKHGLSLSAIAGLAIDHAATHNVSVIAEGFQSGYRDDATIAQHFIGPKGGGYLEYATKRFAVSTEATFGYLHANGTYTDDQSEPSSGGIVLLPRYKIGGTAGSSELNWRTMLAVPITKQLSLTMAYERRSINTPNGDYIFGGPNSMMAPPGYSNSQFTSSNPTMVGFKFRL